MVDFSDVRLDRAFAALADPTRRAILDRLAQASELAVTEIAGRFDVSLPAVMKHLDVLARAGLIERAKTGRTVNCRPAGGADGNGDAVVGALRALLDRTAGCAGEG
jgi:DNA-binding transcriptional ArsR family regulator